MQTTAFSKNKTDKNSQKQIIQQNPQTSVKKAQNLKFSELEQFYINGCKNNKLIGLEYERLSLDKNTYENAPYGKLAKIIEHFCQIQNWELIYDNQTIIGAQDTTGTTLSLEPGCQLELSLAPQKDIFTIENKASYILNLLDKIGSIYDVIFLGYGISPKSKAENIELLNKQRYKIMNNYLPNCEKAKYCTKMMRQTAGFQVNIDYSDKSDCYNKLKFFNLIMPFMSALCANSPLQNDTICEYKTQRAQVWRYTGSARCNLFYKNIFKRKFFVKKDVFKEYIEEILDVPMIYVERDGKNILINGEITFREYMKKGYQGLKAQYQDYILHQSLCFPDVRLKNYIEIRNHDSNSLSFALSICALYKGLCECNFDNLLKHFDYLETKKIDFYNEQIILKGLDFEAKQGIFGWNIISELINISRKKLNSKDRIYLKPIIEILKTRKTCADIIKEHNISNSKELVDYINS